MALPTPFAIGRSPKYLENTALERRCTDVHTLLLGMEFEWDASKAQANRRKHGIDFADAVEVFYGRRAARIERQRYEEKR